jgi:hypothetical protein
LSHPHPGKKKREREKVLLREEEAKKLPSGSVYLDQIIVKIFAPDRADIPIPNVVIDAGGSECIGYDVRGIHSSSLVVPDEHDVVNRRSRVRMPSSAPVFARKEFGERKLSRRSLCRAETSDRQ